MPREESAGERALDNPDLIIRAELEEAHSRITMLAFGNLLVGLLVVVMLQGDGFQQEHLVWYGLLVLVASLRFWLMRHWKKRPVSEGLSLRARLRSFVLLSLVTSLIWAGGIWWFFPLLDQPRQLMLAMVVIAFVAGALSGLATIRGLYGLYTLIILAPLQLRLWLDGSETYALLAGFLFVYYGYLLVGGQIYRRNFLQALRLRARLEHMVGHDMLTGLPNRLSFERAFEREWRRCCRGHSQLVLVLGDIDHFKTINDRYGHDRGDQVLMEVARRLRSALWRPGDMVARVGGEEFALILPEVDVPGAEVVVRRIMHRLAEKPVELDGGKSVPVTMSFGIADCQPEGECDRAALYRRADQALYAAKAAGRNRYEVG